ncbi:hypothetical protein JCGZ_18584 [Jatropha curcas]|uniref:Uncharacterized protein n=1 Tax=Jatropha curcas TaxID=180498 RepID=A0A067K1K0_JATCU|nr:hypothetical protein JCGZ_18584 [Jatropha curcas]
MKRQNQPPEHGPKLDRQPIEPFIDFQVIVVQGTTHVACATISVEHAIVWQPNQTAEKVAHAIAAHHSLDFTHNLTTHQRLDAQAGASLLAVGNSRPNRYRPKWCISNQAVPGGAPKPIKECTCPKWHISNQAVPGGVQKLFKEYTRCDIPTRQSDPKRAGRAKLLTSF